MRICNDTTSPNFNASLKIINNSKMSGLRDGVEKKMSRFAKDIGSDKDTITITLGKLKSGIDTWCEMGYSYTVTTKKQNIIAESTVNGCSRSENIGYYTGAAANPRDLAASTIWDYLHRLKNRLVLNID